MKKISLSENGPEVNETKLCVILRTRWELNYFPDFQQTPKNVITL